MKLYLLIGYDGDGYETIYTIYGNRKAALEARDKTNATIASKQWYTYVVECEANENSVISTDDFNALDAIK